ncbi:MAG: GDSL-type esterase/lipase family protein [Acidobacteria bacterium]|nr:GDSL-type esterase/lipase family protein [Acidobacteriota bacterium]
MKPSRFLAALLPLAFCAALAQQPAASPIMNRATSLQVYDRDLELMESLAIAIPELSRAGAPITENVRFAITNLRDSSGWAHTTVTYGLLSNLRAFVILADAVNKPYPFPEEALRQLTELRTSVDRVNAHFRALLDQREAILRSPDRDNLRRYAEADALLAPPQAAKPRVVFLGDSITDGWRINEYFPDSDFVNRGISGQITGEMLGRMKADVIDLKPAAMLVLAGTNDLARGTPLNIIQNNLTMIADLAEYHKIKPIFASILPVDDYHQPQTRRRPPEQIKAMNQWLQQLCARRHFTYLDYFSRLVDAKGLLQEKLSDDGLHPNSAGYRIMAPLAQEAIRATVGALAVPAPAQPDRKKRRLF